MMRTKGGGEKGAEAALSLENPSGCESGWTMYLEDQSFGRNPNSNFSSKQAGQISQGVEEEEEEDLSIVSDASSGPPHILDNDDGNGCFWSASYSSLAASAKKNGRSNTRPRKQKHSSVLDDTASSHVFNFTNKNFSEANNHQPSNQDVMEFSVGFSATHFKKQYGVSRGTNQNQLSHLGS